MTVLFTAASRELSANKDISGVTRARLRNGARRVLIGVAVRRHQYHALPTTVTMQTREVGMFGMSNMTPLKLHKSSTRLFVR